jgi:hypothetical protein
VPGSIGGWLLLGAGASAAGPVTNAPASWYTTSSASSVTNRTDPMRKLYQQPRKPGTWLSGSM